MVGHPGNTLRRWAWTATRLRAAELVALGEQQLRDIADTLGVNRRTLDYWCGTPAFRERVAEIHTELNARIAEDFPIARRYVRVGALNDRWNRMRALVDARGEDLAEDTAGGDTGLLVRQTKVLGAGENQQTLSEYAFDRAVLAELRDTEKQAAKEVGQWTDKQDITSGGQAVTSFGFVITPAWEGDSVDERGDSLDASGDVSASAALPAPGASDL